MQKTSFHYSIFFVSEPKNFVGEHFGVSESFGYRKKLEMRQGGGFHDSPSKVFRLKVPKYVVEKPLCAVFQKVFGSEEISG